MAHLVIAVTPGMHLGAELFFGIYLMIYLVALASYAFVVIIERRNFHVAARHPQLLLIELLLNAYMSIVIALRQIYSDLGWSFPCLATNLATHVATTNYMSTYYLRALHLCVIYDEGLRKKMYMYVSKRGTLSIFAAVSLVTLTLWLSTNNTKLCHSRCQVPNCFLGSIYYFSFAANQIVLGLLLVIASKMISLKIRDQIGIKQELVRAFFSSFTLVLFPYYTIVVLLDWGVIDGHVWEWVATLSILLLLFCLFCWTHLLPSIKYGYTPLAVLPKAFAAWAWGARIHATSDLASTLHSTRALAIISNQDANGVVDNKLQAMYTDPEVLEVFRGVCRSFLCEESLLFLLAVLDLQTSAEQMSIKGVAATALNIVNEFVRPGSEYEINISSSMIAKLLTAVEAGAVEYAPDKTVRRNSLRPTAAELGLKGSGDASAAQAMVSAFYPAFKEVQKMLHQNVLPKLEASPHYQDAYAKFLLRGEQIGGANSLAALA